MRFFTVSLLAAMYLFISVDSCFAGALKPKESVELKISARIIGFKTAKLLCGSTEPPTWCPVHLLATNTEPNDLESDLSIGSGLSRTQLAKLDVSEIAKRERIRKAKLLYGYD